MWRYSPLYYRGKITNKVYNLLGIFEVNSPLLQFKRFRGKINIQRPRAPHYERARVIAVTTPIYPKKEQIKPCADTEAIKLLQKKIDNPYEIVLAKEVRSWFDHSPMVGFFHINPINADDYFKAKVAFHKSNMHLKTYGKSIVNRALRDSKFEAVLPVFAAKTCIVFSKEPGNVTTMIKIVKKIPQMHLICGIVEDRLLSKNEMIEYSKMPDLTTVRAQFVAVLNSCAGSQIVQNLESHQQQLVNLLDTHVRENNGKEEPKT